jgi:hypothetical protein
MEQVMQRTLADVVRTIENGEFYNDFDQSVADLAILRAAVPAQSPPVSADLIVGEAFGVPFAELDRIKEAVLEAVKLYGDDDGPTHQRILRDGIWNDHIAVQAGIAVWKMLKGVK